MLVQGQELLASRCSRPPFFIRKAAIRAGLRTGLISCGSSFRLIDASFSDSFSGREKGPKKCPPTVRGHFFGPISQSENDSQFDSEIEAHSGPSLNAAPRNVQSKAGMKTDSMYSYRRLSLLFRVWSGFSFFAWQPVA